VLIGAILINGHLTRRYARNYSTRMDMLGLTQALGEYATKNNNMLPTQWKDLEAQYFVILGEKGKHPNIQHEEASRVEHPNRCHWELGASVANWARTFSSRAAVKADRLLLYSDDLSWEDNLVYNWMLIEKCGFRTPIGVDK
jgi:hypothetical protein